MASVARRYGILALGIVAIVAGAIVLLLWRPQPASGWTAYAPLSDTYFQPGVSNPGEPVGFVLLGVGLCLSAGWVGFALARRRPRI